VPPRRRARQAAAKPSRVLSRALDLVLRFRRLISVAVHAALILVAHLGAFWLRFDAHVPPQYWHLALAMLPWVLMIRVAVFLPLRLFEGLWKYSGLWDLRNIIIGVALSTAAFYVLAERVAPDPFYPRSIYIIDSIVLILLLGGVRMSRRIYRELRWETSGRRVLIYGAGDAGEMIVRDMRQNDDFNGQPVGFIDDDYRKKGQRIHGVPVLGTRNEIGEILCKHKPDEVLIAVPSASRDTLREIVRALEPHKVRITTLPRLSALVDQTVNVEQIRQLKVEDLLARDPVGLDYAPVIAFLARKCVLVTGAGGSIGSELCRQIAAAQPRHLVLVDRYENSLFQITNELSAAGLSLKPVIADITDPRRVNQVMAELRPDVVFHAAAHKHVPLMEENPCEAIKNNVRGTRVMAEAAQQWNVERFVMISTDKAVNPTSMMGASKRLAELAIDSFNNGGPRRFVTVRFGNVLASNGSVVPVFLAQIAKGGPVTVTHPEMRRYFMLIPEAVQLVLHAAALPDASSLYVLDMGEQVKVVDMARNLIRLSGYVPEKDIAITYTGIRPGEKLYEELVGQGEVAEPSSMGKVMRVHAIWQPPYEGAQLRHRLEHLEQLAADGETERLVLAMTELLPNFSRPIKAQALPA
jgi:FlaA1/EpsC-like NDP-sugar epimerase